MKRKTKGVVAGVVGCILLTGSCVVLGMASKGFTDWSTEDWKDNIQNVFPKEEKTNSTTSCSLLKF